MAMRASKKRFLKDFRLLEELSLEEKIQKVENWIDRENEARFETLEKLEAKQVYRNNLLTKLTLLFCEYGSIDYTQRSFRYLQQALEEHQSAQRNRPEMKMKISCHHLKHGKKTLAEEKQIVGEIKSYAEGRKEKVHHNDANAKAKHEEWIACRFQEVIKSEEEIKYHMKILDQELQDLRMQKMKYFSKESALKKKIETSEKSIMMLDRKFEDINERRAKLYDYILELKY